MISDFKHLLEKIQQLADMTALLRRENADLRQQAATLQLHNAELASRMQDAHERVLAVMRRLPADRKSVV